MRFRSGVNILGQGTFLEQTPGDDELSNASEDGEKANPAKT